MREIMLALITDNFRRLNASRRKHGIAKACGMSVSVLVRGLLELPANMYIHVGRLRSTNGHVLRLVQGSKMLLDLSDAGISKELFLDGVHEANSTRQFMEEIKPGMVLLEVGANIGYYALIASRLVQPGGKVLALEPSPTNTRLLKQNVELNSMEKVVSVYQLAAGSCAETRPFYVSEKSNTSGFLRRHDIGIESCVLVKVQPVDDFLEAKGLRIDYFRMDVEGFETEVIAGMTKTLTGDSPPSGGFIEVHSRILNENGSSARSFLEGMYRFGYQVKKARYRGRDDVSVDSNEELYAHSLLETGYWETFFAQHG